jgi:hypothetical protein
MGINDITTLNLVFTVEDFNLYETYKIEDRKLFYERIISKYRIGITNIYEPPYVWTNKERIIKSRMMSLRATFELQYNIHVKQEEGRKKFLERVNKLKGLFKK